MKYYRTELEMNRYLNILMDKAIELGVNHFKGNERISSIGSHVPLHIHLRWMMGKLFTPNVSIMTCVHSTRVLVMVCIESYWAIFIIAHTFHGTNIYVDIHTVDLT